MSKRPAIPSAARQTALYNSANACVICHKENVQLHHIDEDRTNNDLSNLVVICQEHHGEAHTTRKLTQSLSPARIKDFKRRWENEVQERRQSVVTQQYQQKIAGEFLGCGISWGYINHSRVSGMISKSILSSVNQKLLSDCIHRGLVDQQGIITLRPREFEPSSYLQASIYDRFTFGDDHRVHRLYSEIVDIIAQNSCAIHIDDHSFTKTWVSNILYPGAFVFLNRGHYFRELEARNDNVTRLAYVQERKVKFEYIVETRDMFGTSSMTVSFSGRRSAAALLMIKSINDVDGTTIDCTPIALGAGQWASARP